MKIYGYEKDKTLRIFDVSDDIDLTDQKGLKKFIRSELGISIESPILAHVPDKKPEPIEPTIESTIEPPTIRVYYNKTLGMTDGKLAAQVAHAVAGLSSELGYNPNCKIIVLGARATKFFDLFENLNTPHYMQIDQGLTEVEAGEHTAFAYIDLETPETP